MPKQLYALRSIFGASRRNRAKLKPRAVDAEDPDETGPRFVVTLPTIHWLLRPMPPPTYRELFGCPPPGERLRSHVSKPEPTMRDLIEELEA
jgi:hypothetical protein